MAVLSLVLKIMDQSLNKKVYVKRRNIKSINCRLLERNFNVF